MIEPAVSLRSRAGRLGPPLPPGTLRFRDGDHFRPVAPFFELWLRYRVGRRRLHDEPLTREILRKAGATTESLSYVVTAANLKAARRTGDAANGFQTQLQVAGNDYRRHELLASSLRARRGRSPWCWMTDPIRLGTFQVIRPDGRARDGH